MFLRSVSLADSASMSIAFMSITNCCAAFSNPGLNFCMVCSETPTNNSGNRKLWHRIARNVRPPTKPSMIFELSTPNSNDSNKSAFSLLFQFKQFSIRPALKEGRKFPSYLSNTALFSTLKSSALNLQLPPIASTGRIMGLCKAIAPRILPLVSSESYLIVQPISPFFVILFGAMTSKVNV